MAEDELTQRDVLTARMKHCRLFHDWDWIEEIPGHNYGCPMTGTCQRCGKTKYIRYVNWGDPKHKGARLRVPLETQDGPPPPPRERARNG